MSRKDWNRPDDFKRPEEGQRRIRLTVSYDGTLYHGWQCQPGEVSVQATISQTLTDCLKEEITVVGSGRTDAGVHALGQVCHFDTYSRMAVSNVILMLNTKLPKSIRVMDAAEAGPDFHARFTTMSREYWYLVKKQSEMTSFDDKRYLSWRKLPSLDLLNAYASTLVGTHDYTTFASARDDSESRMRDIYLSQWESYQDSYGYTVYRYRVAGNAFLYHQVRSMVGTMLEAAKSEESVEAFQARLDAKDRTKALRTASAEGLYLAKISYDPEEYQWFEEQYGQHD